MQSPQGAALNCYLSRSPTLGVRVDYDALEKPENLNESSTLSLSRGGSSSQYELYLAIT